MPRPMKCRKVCHLPLSCEFKPSVDDIDNVEPVVLTVDEYEAIRLIDHEGFTQEECGKFMKIARTTVQEIYTNARRKLSVALIEAKPLQIDGGDFRLCDGKEEFCRCGGCVRHRRHINETKEQNL